MLRMLKLQALGLAIVLLSASWNEEETWLRMTLVVLGWLALAGYEILSMTLESRKAGKGEA